MKQTTAIYTLTSELHDEKAVSAVTQAFLTSLGIARSSSSNCWISPLLPSASANHLHRFANQVPVPMIRDFYPYFSTFFCKVIKLLRKAFVYSRKIPIFAQKNKTTRNQSRLT